MVEISIIVATYNSEKSIKKTIDSILEDSFQAWECLICDDCSTDKTIELIKRYVGKDKRFRIILQESNRGAAEARNKAIGEATGKYIAILDSDDLNVNDRLEKQYQFLEKHSKYALVAAKSYFFNEKNIWSIKEEQLNLELDTSSCVKGMPIIHPTLMIRKKVIDEIEGYPNYRRVQDYAMLMEIFARGYKGYIMNEYLLKYRCDDANYKRRTLKSRIIEMKIRYHGYKRMNIKLVSRIYLLKPLMAGIIPSSFMRKYHKKNIIQYMDKK